MARTRSIRNKKKREKKEPVDVDITSLLDILVILLVFLLRSYNSSGVTFTVPKGIELPKSASISMNRPGVIVQVSKDKIWVDDKVILDISDKKSMNGIFDEGNRRIVPLYSELVKKKEEIKAMAQQVPQAKPFSGVTNLIIDKSIKFNYIKKVLYTAAAAGFKEYKFIVLGEEY